MVNLTHTDAAAAPSSSPDASMPLRPANSLSAATSSASDRMSSFR